MEGLPQQMAGGAVKCLWGVLDSVMDAAGTLCRLTEHDKCNVPRSGWRGL